MFMPILLTAAVVLCNSCWKHGLFGWAANVQQPGYLDFDNLPDTNFSCDGKVIGGYYADVETGCQMFHVCTIGQKSEITDIKFLCLNGTVFDQATRVCERVDEVDCSKSEAYFGLNLELYGNNAGSASFGIQPEDESSAGNAEDKGDEEEGGEEGAKDDKGKECGKQDGNCDKKVTVKEENVFPEDDGDYIAEEEEEMKSPPTTTVQTTTTAKSATILYPPYQGNAPVSTPDTMSQLLALHKAFQESFKQSTSTTTQPPPPPPPPLPPLKTYYDRSVIPKLPKPPPVPPLSRFPYEQQGLLKHSQKVTTNRPVVIPTTYRFQNQPHAQQHHYLPTSERFGSPIFHRNYAISSSSSSSPSSHPPAQSFNVQSAVANSFHQIGYRGGGKPFNYDNRRGDDDDSHANFARAVSEGLVSNQGVPKSGSFVTNYGNRSGERSPAVSVVLSTSSVSSSVSSKPHSAIILHTPRPTPSITSNVTLEEQQQEDDGSYDEQYPDEEYEDEERGLEEDYLTDIPKLQAKQRPAADSINKNNNKKPFLSQ